MSTAPSASPGSTTLRPRNSRRVPREHLDGAHDPSRPTSPTTLAVGSSTTSSGTVSPIPRARSSLRPASTEGQSRSVSTGGFPPTSLFSSAQFPPSSSTTIGVWESSWASLRGIASDIIGSNASRASSPDAPSVRLRRPAGKPLSRSGEGGVAQWGPSVSGRRDPGTGTQERQRAEVEARKRERLLIAGGHETPDTIGRYKRRASFDRDREVSRTSESMDRDALVYIHKVKPGDTLAGVMIKYNCQPHVFKRVNRLWPNDSIQSRKIVVLPVDACSKRGRKITDAELSQPLGESPSTDTLVTPKASNFGFYEDASVNRGRPQMSIQTSPSLSATPSSLDNPAYIHESWVAIEGFAEAVEIARMSRRTLGYFPQSRRKSQSFSDWDSPEASLDISRDGSQSFRHGIKGRSRSSSTSYFAKLQGPGGVGSMSTNVKNPGPANDGLNKLFPSLEQQVAPRVVAEPHANPPPPTHGLENIGGSIESWVRKLASRASTSLQPPTPRGHREPGDLIELSEDAFELRDSTQGDYPSLRGRLSNHSDPGEHHKEDSDFEEAFPERGRVFYDTSRQHR